MCIQDVVFLPSLAIFFGRFLKNCGRGKILWTATCLRTALRVSKIILLVIYSEKDFFASVKFHGDLKTITKLR